MQTRIIDLCCDSTEQFAAQDLRISEHIDYFGTVLSLLDRLSSCYWGCHKGDHTKEYLLGRACTTASAAWILIRHGHYDASLSLAREIGEIANLFMLFNTDDSAFDKWKMSDDKTRMREFAPMKVRLALEKLSAPIPISQNIYKILSERATHVTPDTRPELYSNSNHPLSGGTFQEDGVRTCLAHLGYAFGMTALTATTILKPAKHRAKYINASASSLIDSSKSLIPSPPSSPN